ncbi:MAG TPA: exo-alpha-sialidase [Acidimicrobiales bacterium]|nr:exo-alpha-sialidase [Acidimicrobiales bacterium]
MAIACLVVVASGVALSRVTDNTKPPVYEMAATDNVIINQDGLINAHNSPTVVQSPADANTLVVVDRVDRPTRSGAVHVSHDFGRTWKDEALKLPAGTTDQGFAPDAVFTKDGTLVVAFSTVPGSGAIPTGVWVSTSADKGDTLSDPVQALGPYNVQVRLAADPSSGDVYMTWLQGDQAAMPESCLPCFARTGLPIMAARSSDAGKTWSAPVRVSDDGRERVGAATPVVGPNGSVYVAYMDYKDDKDDWENTDAAPTTSKFEVVLARSTDKGASFGKGVSVDPDLRTLERFLVFFPKYPALAVSPAGDLYVAWQDARRGDYDVFVRRSVDAGQSWNGPFRVNDDPAGNGRHQYLPTLSASVAGRVDILYYDRRDDPRNILAGAYFATSYDNGEDWQSLPVSSQLFDSRIGPGAERKNPDPGSHLGLISLPDGAYGVWSDSRKGSLDTDRQDIVGGKVVITKKT